MKKMLKKILGTHLINKLSKAKRLVSNLILLVRNSFTDAKLFYLHSMVFKDDTFNKIESRIILRYHGIEKGFLFEKFKHRFGKSRVIELVKLLKNKEVIKNNKQSQIAAAYLAMCKYFERHLEDGIDISDYFKIDDYELFKSLSTLDLDIINVHNRSDFFEKSNANFSEFSKSRGSVRSFTGEKIPIETINKIIDLAKTAPSVCNRQPTKVYYVEIKSKIDQIFDIQQGLRGYSDEIVQLLVLVSDRNYFYTIGERNQLYIDGGMFLMNLLYAIHFHNVGACPAHWGLNYKQEKEIHKELNLTDSEKVICLVPIGIPKNEFKTTLSLRRNNDEILKIVN